MSGDYTQKIKPLPRYDGRFTIYQLAADNGNVLFASYPSGTQVSLHTHDTDNHGVITNGELVPVCALMSIQ